MIEGSPEMFHSILVGRPSIRSSRDSCCGEFKKFSIARTATMSEWRLGWVNLVSPQEIELAAAMAKRIPTRSDFPETICSPRIDRTLGGNGRRLRTVNLGCQVKSPGSRVGKMP